jgi:hypothetical protein
VIEDDEAVVVVGLLAAVVLVVGTTKADAIDSVETRTTTHGLKKIFIA